MEENKNILLVACEDKALLEEVTKLATEHKVDVAIVDSSVLKQKISQNQVADPSPNIEAVDKFLANDENRKVARMQAEKLYAIMTRGAKQENALKYVFNQTDVVRATTLTHKSFGELFSLLKAFNFVEWVDEKKRKFRFTFNQEQCLDCITRDIRNMSKLVAVEVVRYKNYLNSITTFEQEKKDEMLKKMRKTVIEITRV